MAHKRWLRNSLPEEPKEAPRQTRTARSAFVPMKAIEVRPLLFLLLLSLSSLSRFLFSFLPRVLSVSFLFSDKEAPSTPGQGRCRTRSWWHPGQDGLPLRNVRHGPLWCAECPPSELRMWKPCQSRALSLVHRWDRCGRAQRGTATDANGAERLRGHEGHRGSPVALSSSPFSVLAFSFSLLLSPSCSLCLFLVL